MERKVFYIENTKALTDTLDKIVYDFPCWISREFIEMNYSEVGITVRAEDMSAIMDRLAPLV